MITKNEFVKRWYYGTAKERLELAETICSSKDYKDMATGFNVDSGCALLTSILGELVVLKLLDMNNIDYGKLSENNFIKQRGDEGFIDFNNKDELEFFIYSKLHENYVLMKIRTTGRKCITGLNTVSVPEKLLCVRSKDETFPMEMGAMGIQWLTRNFKARYLFIMDGFYIKLKNQDRNSSTYGTFGPSDYADSHIILVDRVTGDKMIMANHAETCELIESILVSLKKLSYNNNVR